LGICQHEGGKRSGDLEGEEGDFEGMLFLLYGRRGLTRGVPERKALFRGSISLGGLESRRGYFKGGLPENTSETQKRGPEKVLTRVQKRKKISMFSGRGENKGSGEEGGRGGGGGGGGESLLWGF